MNQVGKMPYGVIKDGQQYTTRAGLIKLIRASEQNQKGVNFFSLTQVTKETTNKAPHIRFEMSGLKSGKTYFAKISQVNGFWGSNYSDAVNRQLTKEGKEANFTAKKSTYDQFEDSRALQTKGDQFYLSYRPKQVAPDFEPLYFNAVAENPSKPADFGQVEKDHVEGFKSKSKGSGYYQGVDNAIEFRRVSLDSIVAIKIDGIEYIVEDIDDMRSAIFEKSGVNK